MFIISGRRLAEQEIYIGLSRILQKFEITTFSNEMPQSNWNTLLAPKLPLPLIFKYR